MSDLLPCPMCGGPAALDTLLIRIVCLTPDCPMPPIVGRGTPHKTSSESAAERWNTRAGTRTPAPGGAALTFAELAAANASRCAIWHPGGLDEWSVADWAVAMAGEAGEVCNAVKKLRRVEGDTVGANGPTTREAAIEAIAQEIADTAIYLDLLAQRIGIRLEDCVVAKFNKVSEREGFPHRLTALLQEGTGG